MILFVIALHNHQPVGNFDWVFQEAFDRAYRPLMEVIGRFPSIHFAQHYTGILLDWFAEHEPEFVEVIRAAVDSGRMELMTGGYFEPIMAMLPERDRQAQVRALSNRLAAAFGTTPSGMWLAERVWEPSIPSTVAPLGVKYTILDDTHFRAAGLQSDEIHGYFLTEDQGQPLAVFPIDKRLRYTIPFEPPEVTIDYLKELDVDGVDRVVVFADDGEKFGIWPDTYVTVYEEKWLSRFCELLETNGDWLRTITPRDVIETVAPTGRIYLPTASYSEMLHWALPNPDAFTEFEEFERKLDENALMERFGAFVRGGFWRNFLVKYPEINAMQKRMLRLSRRFDVAASHAGNDPAIAPLLESAYEHLLASQCNCPYWHGVFGGIYLSNIRTRVYSEMIQADALLDRIVGLERGSVTREDYDLDGNDEIVYENPMIGLYLSPAQGGTIFEFDHKPSGHNLANLVARRREGYHARLLDVAVSSGEPEEARSIHDIVRVKEAHLERALVYDPWRRSTLRDHFFTSRPTAAGLVAGTVKERGTFSNATYEAHHERTGTTTTITMRCTGRVGRRPVAVSKSIHIEDRSPNLLIDYEVRSLDDRPLRGRIGIELAFTLSAGTEPDRYYEVDGTRTPENHGQLNGTGQSYGSTVALVDQWMGLRVTLTFASRADILRAPVETVSLSEDGFERNYQGSVVMPVWDLQGMEWRTSFRQVVEQFGE